MIKLKNLLIVSFLYFYIYYSPYSLMFPLTPYTVSKVYYISYMIPGIEIICLFKVKNIRS